jgi:ParB family chromosome partitioning protein
MAEERRRSLGRGLSALLGEDHTATESVPTTPAAPGAADRPFRTVAVDLLRPGKYQPRHMVDSAQIDELAQSIKEKGIIQPILVRRHPDDKNAFEIIAGERRWRAAQKAELHEVPVIVRSLSDQDSLEIALVENLQRQDLSALEEAQGYRRLMDEFSHTQEMLAKILGKSRSHVANTLRLLTLPDGVKALMDKGDLSAGHARALLAADDPLGLARKVVKKGLNVRQTETLVKGGTTTKTKTTTAATKDADTLALERELTNLLGLKVDIHFKGGGGHLTLYYQSLEQLDDLIDRLSQRNPKSRPANED